MGAHEPRSVGRSYHYDRRQHKWLETANDPSVDWAGNKVPPKRDVSQREHESEVLMSIAGGMAEIVHRDDEDWKNWKSRASGADIRLARNHRGQIERPKTWEQYEAQTHAMLLQFWPMIEAVAAALTRHGFLDAGEVDRICGRVVRRQHLKTGKVQPVKFPDSKY